MKGRQGSARVVKEPIHHSTKKYITVYVLVRQHMFSLWEAVCLPVVDVELQCASKIGWNKAR